MELPICLLADAGAIECCETGTALLTSVGETAVRTGQVWMLETCGFGRKR